MGVHSHQDLLALSRVSKGNPVKEQQGQHATATVTSVWFYNSTGTLTW